MDHNEKALLGWYKRIEKKAPFYLFRTEPLTNWVAEKYPNSQRYWLIWQEIVRGETKTKMGVAEDAMLARYGFSILAVLTGNSITGLWQASANSIDEKEMQALFDVANDKTDLPIFNIRSIRNVSW